MAQGASRAPFWGPKNRGPLKKGPFAARTHFEAYNSPHFVIWERRFYKTTPVLHHRSLNSYNSRYFPSPSINVQNNLNESHATVPLKLFQHENINIKEKLLSLPLSTKANKITHTETTVSDPDSFSTDTDHVIYTIRIRLQFEEDKTTTHTSHPPPPQNKQMRAY